MHDQHRDREELFRNISSAVEKIQAHVAKGSDVIWNCNAVDKLCFCMEDIFNHGLKEGLLSWASNNQVSFWSLANKITCKKDLEDINRLPIKSDEERCLAWIRQGLKENTLASYLNVITQDEKLLREFYHSHAFLCDRENADKVTALITYGISHLDFDISLTSNSRRHTEAEAPPVLVSAANLTHLPERSSLVNGYGSPSNSWNGHEHSSHWYSKETGRLKIDESGKKKKKRKKAGVAMIAESADVEESQYIEKVIQMHRDFDLETPDKETKTNVNITEDDQRFEKAKISQKDLTSEGETSSVISLEMELPATETLLQKIITDEGQHSSNVVPETEPNFIMSEEITVNGTKQHGENSSNTYEGKNKETDLMTEGLDSKFRTGGNTLCEPSSVHESNLIKDSWTYLMTEGLDSKFRSDGNTVFEQSSVHESNLIEDSCTDLLMEGLDSKCKSDGNTVCKQSSIHESNLIKDTSTDLVTEGLDSKCKSDGNTLCEQSSVHESNLIKDTSTDLVTEGLDSECKSDGNTVCEQSSVHESNLIKDTCTQVVECQMSSQNPFEGLMDEENDHDSSNKVAEEVNAASEPETTEHFAALAAFECGTPKQVDSIWQIEKERALSNTSYEGEDLNIIPGIHKNTDRHSLSESSGSFNGSGSIQVGSQRSSRNNTMDSVYPTSTFGSSSASDSWLYRSGSSSRKSSKADVGFNVGSPDSEFSEYEMFDELLGLEEDHFSPPESFMGVSTSEELHHAIDACKDLINTAPEDSEEKNKLVNKLVQLRLKLQETQDSKTTNNSDARKILSHVFVKEEDTGAGKKLSCDKCGKTIWMWQSLFTCKDCNYHSHRRCLELIRRPCASRKVPVSTYNLKISPETGLSSQQYKCAECRKQIGLTRGERSEGRLCDYTGQYFCEECHWNDHVVIPARVVHNWDFTTYKVSRQSKQFLALMSSRPLLKIEKLNPALFKFVVELREVKRLREEILIMKKYFVTCREALESKLLLQLKNRQHFVDSANIYSLDDLIDVNSGLLLPFLTKVHSLFLTHIKSDCQLCQAKGFVCEICGKDEIIFAFDPHSTQCKECRAVFHKICFKSGVCPKCERKQKRSHAK